MKKWLYETKIKFFCWIESKLRSHLAIQKGSTYTVYPGHLRFVPIKSTRRARAIAAFELEEQRKQFKF